MKSVLHIGLDILSHSRKGLENGFRQAGFTEYNFLAWQNIRMEYGILATQERMITIARKLTPDVIFCQFQNSDILDEETVIELSKCGFTVNYTYDCRAQEEMKWYYDLAPFFGLTLFACKEDADEARRLGINNVGNIHSSCDPEQYLSYSVRQEVKAKYPEIVFIGSNYENTNLQFELKRQRAGMVGFMKNQFGNKFGVFGMNWVAESKYYNPIDENNIYNTAKISVCHNNFLRTSYTSDRQWRSMACGIATVPQYYPGIEADHIGGLEYAWETVADLDRICRRLLDNEDERKDLSVFQHSSFIAMHTWRHRIDQMKIMILKILNQVPLSEYVTHFKEIYNGSAEQ